MRQDQCGRVLLIGVKKEGPTLGRRRGALDFLPREVTAALGLARGLLRRQAGQKRKAPKGFAPPGRVRLFSTPGRARLLLRPGA